VNLDDNDRVMDVARVFPEDPEGLSESGEAGQGDEPEAQETDGEGGGGGEGAGAPADSGAGDAVGMDPDLEGE
jgi:hypothetical protein